MGGQDLTGVLFAQGGGGGAGGNAPLLTVYVLVMFAVLAGLFFVLHRETRNRRKRNGEVP